MGIGMCVGGILGAPQVSGSLQGTMNFSNPIGLTTSSFTPNFSTISPGYSQLTLGNLNDGKFMADMRVPVDPKIIEAFVNSNWPDELVNLMYIQKLQPSACSLRRSTAAERPSVPAAQHRGRADCAPYWTGILPSMDRVARNTSPMAISGCGNTGRIQAAITTPQRPIVISCASRS
jgi:hypothetical protein